MEQLGELIEEDYQALFQEMPFQEKPHLDRLMRAILGDPKVRQVFNLN